MTKEKIPPLQLTLIIVLSMSTGEAALSRGAGKGAGDPAWPGGSGSRGQARVLRETSGARNSTQESSRHSDFPVTRQPASDSAE